VIPAFIEAALDGRPFPLQGSGEQTRSFCFVSDLVEALLTVAMAPLPTGQIFNLGNPHEITVRELAERISSIFEIEPQYEFLPAASDDPSRRSPDISHIKAAFGWQPHTGLDDGLRATVRYFQQLRELAIT
jgi:UDP-glucuronate decarboxylase